MGWDKEAEKEEEEEEENYEHDVHENEKGGFAVIKKKVKKKKRTVKMQTTRDILRILGAFLEKKEDKDVIINNNAQKELDELREEVEANG